MQETWFDPWVRKIPWRRTWHPTAIFLPGESRGQRSLAGYSPWDRKELDTTERLNNSCVAWASGATPHGPCRTRVGSEGHP